MIDSLEQTGLFDDGKDPQALRTIGEVAAALDIKPHVLRYWEEQFAMLKPVKRSGGRRYYRAEDVALLRRIDTLLNREGYTIRGAAKALRESRSLDDAPDPSSATLADGSRSVFFQAPEGDREALAARLRSIREALSQGLA